MTEPAGAAGLHVLVVGGGGREHALAWACARSPEVARVSCAPGNGGTAQLGSNWNVAATDAAGIAGLARAEAADLVILGPDAAVAAGVGDALGASGISFFGPTRAAGELEISKAFGKELMARVGIRTAPFAVCRDPDQARRQVRLRDGPVVVKADGLALGKGAFVCQGPEEAASVIDRLMVRGALGEAGRTVIIEDRLEGPEVSLFALCDGERAVMLPPACDYKRALDGDLGGNTGGMGSYAPPRLAPADELNRRALAEIVAPTLAEMSRLGRPFRGCLYIGGMLVGNEINVLEYNARFGDPEAEVLLPLLSDPVPLLRAVAAGDLGLAGPPASAAACSVGVVAVREPYPEPVQEGGLIEGVADAEALGCLVFHMGTKAVANRAVGVAGGRVLICVATGVDLRAARGAAYAGMAQIHFEGIRYRSDIAA